MARIPLLREFLGNQAGFNTGFHCGGGVELTRRGRMFDLFAILHY